MLDLLNRQAVFCGGKGGVGKTCVAGALGLLAARAGQRVLVVSTDPAHSLGDLLERRLGDRPVRVEAGFAAMELDPDRTADGYLDEVTQRLREYVRPAMYGEIDRQMAQARHAPGATEAAVLERVAGLLAEPPEDVDLMIFDTAPTGHTLRLLSLPETMAAWSEGMLGRHRESEALGRALRGIVPGGGDAATSRRRQRLSAALERRRQLFGAARDRLTDPGHTAFVLVLIPERLPVEETGRALDALKAAAVPVAALVINQVLPEAAESGFLKARRGVQDGYLEQIDRRFENIPRIRLPLLETEIRQGSGLDELARHLSESPL